ncbi:MAG: DUF465 domain-containing protein [Acidobacteria bacterium]|nr:DUF465 domain-containing protein [Acidobacteriota bacterium]
MSIPASEAALKDFLFNHDEKYRELANEHHKYDARLSELISLSHPSEDEQIEEAILKKKKLLLKDQMEMIAKSYKASATSH